MQDLHLSIYTKISSKWVKDPETINKQAVTFFFKWRYVCLISIEFHFENIWIISISPQTSTGKKILEPISPQSLHIVFLTTHNSDPDIMICIQWKIFMKDLLHADYCILQKARPRFGVVK